MMYSCIVPQTLTGHLCISMCFGRLCCYPACCFRAALQSRYKSTVLVDGHLCMQLESFNSDSLRLVGNLRREAQQPVQFLLFSATFNETVKDYALRVTSDNGREKVNEVGDSPQVLRRPCLALTGLQPPSTCLTFQGISYQRQQGSQLVAIYSKITGCGDASFLHETGVILRRSLCQGKTSHWMSSNNTKW